MPKPVISLRAYTPTDSHLLESIVDLHIACITNDNCLLRFHPPFDSAKRVQVAEFWRTRLAESHEEASTILLAFAGDDSTLCGMAELVTPSSDTGPFRAAVRGVMVSPSYQRNGIASQLMRELEEVARRKQRTLIRLGTTKGSPADLYLYPKMGYVKIGEVPQCGIEPATQKLMDCVEYYKHLPSRNDRR